MLFVCQHLVLVASLVTSALAQRITIDTAHCTPEFLVIHTPFNDTFRVSIQTAANVTWKYIALGITVGNRSVLTQPGASAIHAVVVDAAQKEPPWTSTQRTAKNEDGALTIVNITKSARNADGLDLVVDVVFDIDWFGCFGVSGEGLISRIAVVETDMLSSSPARGHVDAFCTHFQPSPCIYYNPHAGWTFDIKALMDMLVFVILVCGIVIAGTK